MPSFYILLESKIANFDIYVNGNRLAKQSDDLERTAKLLGIKSLREPKRVRARLGDGESRRRPLASGYRLLTGALARAVP
jgi:hypothetical protein